MNIEIRDAALQARIQKQLEATGSASAEELLARLLQTQEEQDRWLLENRDAINAKIRRGIEQLDRGEGIPENRLDAHLKSLKAKSKGSPAMFCPLRRLTTWSQSGSTSSNRPARTWQTAWRRSSKSRLRCSRGIPVRAIGEKTDQRGCAVLPGLFVSNRVPSRDQAVAGGRNSARPPRCGCGSQEASIVTRGALPRPSRFSMGGQL